MKPEELTAYVSSLEAAAEVVEAINDQAAQQRRGWDLSNWRFDLVPWGVRFVHHNGQNGIPTEVFVLARLRGAKPPYSSAPPQGPRVWVLLSGG